jgi:HK97 gp10 family phage protein
MDATTLIMQNLDVPHILRHYDFDKVKSDRGGFIRSCCKLHGGSNPTSFVINEDNGLWFCHSGGCGGGDIFTLVEKLEGIPFPKAVSRVAELLGVDIENMEISDKKKRKALNKCGDILIEGIKPVTPKRTGRLREGMRKQVKKTDEGMSVIVSTSSFYDIFQEYGTSRDKSNVGFFGNAVSKVADKAVNAVIEELSK